MKILVCIKQVPEPERVAVDPRDDGFAVLAPFSEFRMNRFDEFAVEEALRIREASPPAVVDALTVGPERAADVVRRAVGMGAEGGVHLVTVAGSDPEPAVVAELIGRYAADRGYDLILTGSQSEDGMHGLVGPMTAGRLGCPCATQVIECRLVDDLSAVRVEREIEGGAREALRLELPALLAVQPGINRPRYPSLSNLLRANRQGLETIDACRPPDPRETVVRFAMVLPQQTRSVEMLTGTVRDKAQRFLSILRQKAFIR